MSLRYRLPFKVNANARGHSRFRQKVKLGPLPSMTVRAATMLLLKPLWRRLAGRAPAELLERGLVITLTRIAPCDLDGHDNLRTALKPVVDGITDALGLKNDRDHRISWQYAQRQDGVRFYAVDVLVEHRPAAGLPCPTCGLTPNQPPAEQ